MKRLKYLISVLALMFVVNAVVNAQNNINSTEISGTVYETATGKPLSGVQITIPGINSVITDENGNYKLTKSIKGAIIKATAPGFATKQIAVNERSKINIYMIDESFKGKYEEVVMPFGVSNLRRTTNAVATHENRSDYMLGASSVENLLQNGLSGLSAISRSGAPGAGVNLNINGINSLNANAQALIVVDGIIYDNQTMYSLIGGNHISALSDIDVKDIDNITVLKDGTSIYGSKGANGVILINTIEAKNTATRIDFYAYAGVNFEPSTKYPMMGSADYKSYLVDMLGSKGLSTNEIQALPYINNELPVVESWGTSGNADYYKYNQNSNWQNEVYKTSFNKNYHLNITGGNDMALYAISVGYLGHDGSVENTNFERYTTRVNAKIKMTDWFALNANMNFVFSQRSLSFEGLNKNFNPVYAALVKSPFMAANVINVEGIATPNLDAADIFGISNPRSIIDNGIVNNNRFRFFSSMNGVLTFNKNLKADIIVGLTTDKVTKETVFMPKAGVSHTALDNGEVTNESQQMRNHFKQISSDFRLTYNRQWDNSHDLVARLGTRIQNNDTELDWGKASNTSSDEMKTLSDGLSELAQIGGSLGNWTSISNYINAEYGYQNKYFVSLNAALDGSSRFGSDAKGLKISKKVFGLFPSINAAWLMSSENFMKGQNIFDVLKMRAGYSVSGNDDIGNYTSQYYYVSAGLLGSYGLVRGNIPNSSLKWETNKKAVLGFDASFLKEKLNVSLDLYSSRTENLISVKQLSTISGIGYSVLNDGSLQNNGIDLNINGRIIDHTDLKWDLGLNISTYKNELLSLDANEEFNSIAGATIRTKVGSSVAQFYGYQTDGIFNTTEEATTANLKLKNSDGTLVPFTAGDVKFVDKVVDGIIDEKDMTVIGDPNPDFFGSINSSLQWKRFTLNAQFGFMVGNDVYNAVRANLESLSNTDNQTIAAIYRWKSEGQETMTPKASWGDPMGNARFSDRWIEDGSYLRLKSLTLAYDLNLKSNFIKGAQIYVTANNLLTLTNYLGSDPEFSTGQSAIYAGIDSGVSPQPRTVLFGFKIGL